VHVIFISAPNRKGSRGGDAVYSKDDLKAIVRYALERGIRVIPEWEMPGHSYGYIGVTHQFVKTHYKTTLPFLAATTAALAWATHS